MSETHELGCFPCGWWKRREGTKADTVGRLERPEQELSVKEVKKIGTQLFPARDSTAATEAHPLSPSDKATSAKDKDGPTNIGIAMEAARKPRSIQESSVEELKTAGAIEESIMAKDTTATETRSSGPPDETKPVKDRDVPTNLEYAMEATKKGLTVLKGIADIVKFPLVKEVIELGIAILDTCQTISDVQSGVKRLGERIAYLLLSVADATKDAEESDRLRKDLEILKECLAGIMRRLEAITSQNKLKSSLLSEPNIKLISECEKDFQDSLDSFQTLRSLEMSENITLIQQQLVTFYGISKDMANNVEEVHIKVEDIQTKVNSIESILAGMKPSKTTGASVRIPQLTSPLFGREDVIQRIAEDLTSSDPTRSRICILAAGGMGKTSTALAVMNHRLIKHTFGEDRYWVPCIQANSLDNFLAILFKHVKADKRTGDPLDDIMATLQETDKRRIILLDNFETPWRGISDGESQLKPILAELDSIPHVSILMTMRSDWAPLETWNCERLDPINAKDSQSLYISIHPDAPKYPDQLKELLDALGHMPYAITLMASRGKRSGANPKQLLEEWRAEGTDMLSRRDEGINRCIELSVENDFVQGSKDAMRILQILSMLPAGVDQEDLSIWAGRCPSEAIETLRDAALIITRRVPSGQDSTTDHHFVLPVVQSYMAQNDRIPLKVREAVLDACYQFLSENNATIAGPNDLLFKNHVAAIASQEANLQALLTDALKDKPPTSMPLSPTNDLGALLAYINYQRWTRPRPEIAEQVISHAQRVAAPRHEAAALFCLGNIQIDLDKYTDARQTFERAHVAYERVGDGLMALRSQLQQVYVDTFLGVSSANLRDALNAIRSHQETASSANDTFDAYISYWYGYMNGYASQPREAIPILEEVAQKFDRLGLCYERAECFRAMARAHADLQNFSAALQHIDQAIMLKNSQFGEGFKTPGIVIELHLRVRYLKGMGRWDDEMEMTLAAALELSREVGLPGAILQLLEELGEVYVRKGDLAAAREAYEEGIRKGHGLDDHTCRWSVEQVENNLKHIDYLCSHPQGSEVTESVLFRPPIRY